MSCVWNRYNFAAQTPVFATLFLSHKGIAHAHSSLVSRCSDPDHHPASSLLALIEIRIDTMPYIVPPSIDIDPRRDVKLSMRSGISWAAVIAGAIVAAAVATMLTVLGSGLGLMALSPFSTNNPSPTTFTVMTAIWLIVTQWISAFFGGYLAGRLRPGMSGMDAKEIGFRDTASGFVTWALTSLFLIGIIAVGGFSLIGHVGRAATEFTSSAAQGALQPAAHEFDPSQAITYFSDVLMRPAQPSAPAHDGAARAEADRILAMSAFNAISQDDRTYLIEIVAAHTGLGRVEAERRVDDVLARMNDANEKVKEATEAARKATSGFLLYTFFSMLIGAFIACVAGAIGGKQRDEMPVKV